MWETPRIGASELWSRVRTDTAVPPSLRVPESRISCPSRVLEVRVAQAASIMIRQASSRGREGRRQTVNKIVNNLAAGFPPVACS